MLRIVIFTLILVLSVWAGIAMLNHPGYLLMVFHPWMIQMPIWFAALATILFLILFYLIVNSFDRVYLLSFRFKNWMRRRHDKQAYSKTQHGLTALIEGKWKKSEQLLIAGIDQQAEPLMNYLGAAKAAHERALYEQRDAYIQKAYQVAPYADIAIGLSQAALELEQGQYEQAQAILNHLRETAPKHPRTLTLLEKVYVRTNNFSGLLSILPAMRKAKVLTAAQAAVFEKNCYREQLTRTNFLSDEDLHRAWEQVPRHVRKHPDMVEVYIQKLSNFPATDKEREELIRKTLKHEWHPALAAMYGDLDFSNLNRQLVIVGGWLNTYGPKPELLLALGKLCVRVQLWGKAKDYFERCLAIGPNPEASLAYGSLLEKLDEPDEALQKYRDGLMHCAKFAAPGN